MWTSQFQFRNINRLNSELSLMVDDQDQSVAPGNFSFSIEQTMTALGQTLQSITPALTTAIETSSRKQDLLLMLDSEHKSAAWGFGFSGRVEKCLGHMLGVLDDVRHQSMLFVE